MKYLLVVGFYCDLYKRKPRARLYFNDQLIDEFSIQNCIETKNLKSLLSERKHFLEPLPVEMLKDYYRKSLPSLRFYEIHVETNLKKTNIKIDIINEDSNYANGFMNRYTLLQFRVISLLPADKKLYSWFFQKICDRKNTGRYAWYRKKNINRLFLFDNAKWIGKNGQNFHNTNYLKIGGNGSLIVELEKKYGILMPKLSNKRIPYIFKNTHLIEILYNKYEEYENQRNTD